MGNDDIEAKIQDEREEGRKAWDHPISFILAAVGSAVGLGNVWRFPYLVSKFGGAPFLIPYLFILVFVGMPILGMELSIGTFFQAGDADAFGSMNPRLRGIGLASVFAGFAITFYYTIIIAWAGIYLVESFQATANIPWITDPDQHFTDISMATDADEFTGQFNWKVFVSLIIMWIFIYLCIFKGVKSTGWVVKFTVPAPLIILIILIIRGAFLEGSGDGIMNYLVKWDPETLSDPTIWSEAIGQVFFSLGVCMGVMTTYSSHNKKSKTNVPMSEKAISLSDTGIALLGGFAIYEMLGYMQNTCLKEEAMEIANGSLFSNTSNCSYYDMKSTGLAFIAYPKGISTLEAPQFWGIVFFGCLIMLGIDSAFSLVETMATFLKDCWIGLRLRPKNWMVALVCCGVGFMAGWLYVFDSGLTMLDIVDHYINMWGMILIGMLECYAVGWVYKIDNQYEKVGRTSVLIHNVGFFGSLLVGTLLGIILPYIEGVDEASGLGVGLAVFIAGWIVATAVSLIMSEGELSFLEKVWAIMGWHGADELRVKANNCVRDTEKEGKWKPNTVRSEIEALVRHDCFAITFGFLIKYFSCALLFVITCVNIKNDIDAPYGGYPARLLAVGQLIFVFMLALVLMVCIFPRIMYDPIKHSGQKSVSGRVTWMLTPKPADIVSEC